MGFCAAAQWDHWEGGFGGGVWGFRAHFLCAGPVERELGGGLAEDLLAVVINLGFELKRDVRFASLCHIRPLCTVHAPRGLGRRDSCTHNHNLIDSVERTATCFALEFQVCWGGSWTLSQHRRVDVTCCLKTNPQIRFQTGGGSAIHIQYRIIFK